MAKRKLKKVIEGNTLTISIVGVEGSMSFTPTELPKEVQEKLPCIALNHILGDAAAGKTGKDAKACIEAKWTSMLDGKMTTRKPAEPSVKQDDLIENFKKLSPKQKAAAAPMMQALGIDVASFMK